MAKGTETQTMYRGVTTALVANCIEVVALGVAAWIARSTSLRAQTAVHVAEGYADRAGWDPRTGGTST
jgi:hypothetical protein